MSWALELRTKLTAQREKTNWEKSLATVAEDSAGERGANNKTKEERTNRRVKQTSETQQESDRKRERKWENERTSERTERSEWLNNADATWLRLRRASHEDVCFQNRLRSARAANSNSKKKNNNNKLGLGLGGLASIIYFLLLGAVAAQKQQQQHRQRLRQQQQQQGRALIYHGTTTTTTTTTLYRIFWDRRCRSALCSLTDDATSPLSCSVRLLRETRDVPREQGQNLAESSFKFAGSRTNRH